MDERGSHRNLFRVEMELERIFSSLGHGMYVVDVDRRILLWNRAAESILGWTEEDALGKDCKEFIGHLNADGCQLCDDECPLEAAVNESHTVFAGTVWGHAKGGDLIPLNVSCAPLFDDKQEMVGAVEVFNDVSREVEVDRMKSEMCSVVAHELRTPLTSMRGYLEMVAEGEVGEVNDEQREFLGIVQSNVDRLQELVSDFLDLDRLESGRLVVHWEELDVRVLAEKALEDYSLLAEEKSLELTGELEDVPKVMGDRQLLERVFANLVSNAIKYTNRGGVRIRVFSRDGLVAISVKDTGVGIPEDELEKIADKFFRASTASQTPSHGSGLGLAITKDIVKKHDGELLIESIPGTGSTFSVQLPAARERSILEEENPNER